MTDNFFTKGINYLRKAGTDVVLVTSGIRMVMQPGSAYDDIKKEKLPESFFIDDIGMAVSFSKAFKKYYKVSHRIDLDRLMRACSILLTQFEGPETDDNPKKLHERLFFALAAYQPYEAEQALMDAVKTFGDILKVHHKKISEIDYLNAVRIINQIYKFYSYKI
ncbi:hypothetical protein JW865_09135 [Candidatus Bathyarchaeota archaeon]|nr:hypothetical protein [Candidatus Bathyarchaeota archaeon]